MKDLIAKLQLDASCALGAIWMHIDAQAARIAELEAQLEEAETLISQTTHGAAERISAMEAQIAAAQSVDTDKLREAFEASWPEIHKAGMDHGWRGIAWASWQSCAASTALQAPVREVPLPADPAPSEVL